MNSGTEATASYLEMGFKKRTYTILLLLLRQIAVEAPTFRHRKYQKGVGSYLLLRHKSLEGIDRFVLKGTETYFRDSVSYKFKPSLWWRWGADLDKTSVQTQCG